MTNGQPDRQNNGKRSKNGNNKKKKKLKKETLIEKYKERVKEIRENRPFALGKDKYYNDEAKKAVMNDINKKLKMQAKRFLRGPGYIRRLVDETVPEFENILYVFVVGSYADEKNYNDISRDWEEETEKLTEDDLSKIKIPKDIDILVVYDGKKSNDEEMRYVKELEKNSPDIELDDDTTFNYEYHAMSFKDFYDFVKSEYESVSKMSQEEIHNMLKNVSRTHRLQIPINSIEIYQRNDFNEDNDFYVVFKELDDFGKNELKERMKEAYESMCGIRGITGYPRSNEEYMDKWKAYFEIAKEMFPEEMRAIEGEFSDYADIYSE